MKNNKYIPLSKQAKANNLKNLWSLTFWLLFFGISAVIANILLTGVFNSSTLAAKINGNSQLMYNIWSIQATVTVLSFFISNIMTSIVKDVFYGLSIKDILTARVKWHEISFWHQSIMSILLVILNLPFVLIGATASVVMLAIINLLFIVYMMNNAFSYVFNSKVIVNRVDKLITKEILTSKTILDLKVFITSLENDTLKRINASDLRKASYNIYFLLRMYETLKENTKKEEVKLLLKTLNKLMTQLVKTGNFEPLNYILNNRIENTLTKEEFSQLTCNLIENVSERFINYTTLDIKENKIDQQLIKWSALKGSKNHVDSVASSFFNYYNSILLNAKITKPTKSKLLSQVFNALSHPEEKNKGQQQAFKIALMHIVKDMILNNNELEFKQLLKTLNNLEIEQSTYSQEVMALINTYVYYLTFNKNVSGKIPKRANEFLHLQPDTMELNSKTLADMLKESNARYIKHFWSVVETIVDYNTNEKLSISRNHLDFNEKVVTKFFLTYWKMFANSLENITLNLSEQNESHYKLTIVNLIQNVKEEEVKDYSLFKDFCAVYQMDYNALKEQEKWRENADKIDEYIRDVYLEHLTNSTLNTISRLNITGTLKQEQQLLKLVKSLSKNLPLYKKSSTDAGASLTLPFVFNKLDIIRTIYSVPRNYHQSI